MANAKGLRLKVLSPLNIHEIRSSLSYYHDMEAVDFLEFGWPVGLGSWPSNSGEVKNHTGALQFPKQVDQYLESGKVKGQVLGPFARSPFDRPVFLSPLNTVAKKDSDDRRIILDLSSPEGDSVNSHISWEAYPSQLVDLHYPSIDRFIQIIHSKGPGCLMYKRDLRSAFRQLFLDPAEIPALAYQWKGSIYVDRVLAMGLASASLACQRTSNILVHMHEQQGYASMAYLDDFSGADTVDKAHEADEALGDLMDLWGLEQSHPKHCPPAIQMVQLGIQFDTAFMQMSVPPEKLEAIHIVLLEWEGKETMGRKELESLIGKLAFLAKCVRQGRLFISRMLSQLSTVPRLGIVPVPQEIKKDVRWWSLFLPTFNGVTIIPQPYWSQVDEVLATDASLEGAGALCGTEYFHTRFPPQAIARFKHINQLELLTIVVSLKLWGSKLAGSRLRLHCDNQVSVMTINTGRSRSATLQLCLRELAFVAASHMIEIKAVHIPSQHNRVPDLLSRWDSSPSFRSQFEALKEPSWKRVTVPDVLFDMYAQW